MISLVIPTRNRSEFLSRAVSYYRERRWRHPLFIADSSEGEDLGKTESYLKSVNKDLCVSHRVWPQETHILAKLGGVLEEVRTPYVVVGADDDFFIPEALERAVGFLQTHPDYSVVHGDAAIVCLQEGVGHKKVAWAERYCQRSIEQATGSGRLLDHLGHYSSTWYSVQRTGQLREHWRQITQVGFDMVFSEFVPTCLSLIHGKAKKLNELYMVRQFHAGMTSAQKGCRNSLFDWIADPDWPRRYGDFRNCLAAALKKQEGISLNEASEVVKRAFWSYLAHGVKGAWNDRYAVRSSRWDGAAQFFPWLRNVWHRLRVVIPWLEPDMSLQTLLWSLSRYHVNFMPVYRAVTRGSSDRLTAGAPLEGGPL